MQIHWVCSVVHISECTCRRPQMFKRTEMLIRVTYFLAISPLTPDQLIRCDNESERHQIQYVNMIDCHVSQVPHTDQQEGQFSR